jgi:hypothetical protein
MPFESGGHVVISWNPVHFSYGSRMWSGLMWLPAGQQTWKRLHGQAEEHY